MPHATQAYPFEMKVMNFAYSLASQLRSEIENKSFLMTLNENGSLESMEFDSAPNPLMPETEKLAEAGTAFLFYDAFEPNEYTWLAWHGIEQGTMERLMSTNFKDEDFIQMANMSSRGKRLNPEKTYPKTWSVMFG
ncbi:MAG: hypothetical protein ACI87A_000313 [Planctomycetota bacterium]|jgi:hypothetical protein